MPRIVGGEVLQDDDPRVQRARTAEASGYGHLWLAAAAALGLAAIYRSNNISGSTEHHVRGTVPSSRRPPEAHVPLMTDMLMFTPEFSKYADKQSEFYESMSGSWKEEDIDLKRLTPKQQIDAMYVTRCATTAYAVGAYYCGDDISSSTQLSGGGLDELAVVLQAGIPRLVLRLHLTQERDTMGHVWIVAADETGRSFHWLQSYIHQYTLRGWLTEHGGARSVSVDDMLTRVAQLRFLTELDEWTDEADRVYKDLFAVSVIRDIKESEGERGGGMFAHQNMKEHRNKIKVSFEALCAFPTPEDSDPHIFQAEGVEEEDEVAAKYGDANL